MLLPNPVLVEKDLEAVSRRAVQYILKIAEESCALRGSFTFALSGGDTPAATYRLLAESPARQQMPWSQTQFFWGDERCVPPDDPRSNYGMVYRTLLSYIDVDPSQVHRIKGEDPSPPDAAAEYAEELPDHFDLLLLGIGTDGHTASLFPGSAALTEHERRVVTTTAPNGEQRISITPPVILSARHILLLAAGAEKAAAISRALTGPLDIATTPAQLARCGTWILDYTAAADLL
ncbi:MAG: 6-phosphogluconolactonase [Armatimonadota bacterium]